jgi:hypothetical protein
MWMGSLSQFAAGPCSLGRDGVSSWDKATPMSFPHGVLSQHSLNFRDPMDTSEAANTPVRLVRDILVRRECSEIVKYKIKENKF